MNELKQALDQVQTFLGCPTPLKWVKAAVDPKNLNVLLLDHANCEKKAAGTALNLMFKYEPHSSLQMKLAQLVREEMLHFEQVLKLMEKKGITHQPLAASRYAKGMLKHKHSHEPKAMIDVLIIGAFIEARSCERFAMLSNHISDAELSQYYRYLLKSESRHFLDYLELARQLSKTSIQDRVDFFRQVEADLIQTPDTEFRFHSGVPDLESASSSLSSAEH